MTDVHSTAFSGAGTPQPSTFVVFPSHPLHPEPKVRWPVPDRPDGWALLRASGISAEGTPELLKMVEWSPEITRPDSWRPHYQPRPRLAYPGQDAMRDYETTLHGLAQYARDLDVLPLSRQLLQHYLDGSGEPVTIDPALLLGHQAIQDAEKANLQRFVRNLVGNVNDYITTQPNAAENIRMLNALRDDDYARLVDEWSSSFGPSSYSYELLDMLGRDFNFRDSEGAKDLPIGGKNAHDLLLSLGQSNVKSRGDLLVKRVGDQLHISGMIDHGIDDRYDFELGQPMGLGGLAMEQYGGAKGFPIRSNWQTHLDGAVELQLGRRTNPRIRLFRPGELPAREE